MASLFDAPSARRPSTDNEGRGDDHDLTRSLQQLTIGNDATQSDENVQNQMLMSPLSRKSSTAPLKLPSRHSSPSPSRSPSDRQRSGSATPSLHRKASMNSLHSASGAGSSQPILRRSSSNQLLAPSSPVQEKPPLTAAGVASDYFKAELEAHHGPVSTLTTQSIVILNDAVYGHRFSRPRTSRNHLSLIVERPERIKANVLGISMAYVRLGGRHSEGAVPPHPKRQVQDAGNIPFRIHKTTRRLSITSPAVTNVHGTKWMDDLKFMCDSAEGRLARGEKELQRPGRVRGNAEAAPPKLHEGDLYLCSESLNAIEGALGAVCEGVDTVFAPGPGPRRAFVGVRPPGHHCSAGDPSGFCWVNNVHVGIMHAAMNHGLTHAAIIDFDLHHGDGSQSITWQHNTRATLATKNAAPWKKTSIGYFSLHDINSYPCEGGDEDKVKNASLCIDNAHGQSIWNVHLQPWKTEQEFWALYETKYSILLEKTRSYLQIQADRFRALNQQPKAAIFLSAGFDASEWESSGMQRHKVNVPTEFYARLSHDVAQLAVEEGLSTEGRIISVLEGGYSDRALFSSTLSHLSGLVGDMGQGNAVGNPTGLGVEMSQRIGTIEETVEVKQETELSPGPSYQPSWWAREELDQIESLMSSPAEAPKTPRQSTFPTFSSPTQASTAKVADPIKMRRSLSGLSGSQRALARPASPPPPEVPWAIAAHELSKILIPCDRQTDSCKAEDLNAEATRARQARQSKLAGATPATTPERTSARMALRGRRPKAPVQLGEGDDLAKSSRNTTAVSTTSSDRTTSSRGTPEPTAQQALRRTSRRLSGVSVAAPKEQLPPLPSTDRVYRHKQVNVPQGTSINRPELAAAGRSQSTNSLPIKKARTPATPRKEAAPRAPRGGKKVAATPNSKATTAAQPESSGAVVSSSDAINPSDDMDRLTSGMKRIKINLITKSQKDAKERSRAQHDSSITTDDDVRLAQSNGSTPLVSPSTLASGPSTSIERVMGGASAASDTSVLEAKEQRDNAFSPSEDELGEMITLPSLPRLAGDELTSGKPGSPLVTPSSPAVPHVEIQPSSDPADIFIPYQPEGPTPVPTESSEPIKWLPPNLNTPATTPSPVKKQTNLFHYTAGSIPFAPRSDAVAKARGIPEERKNARDED